MIDVEFPTKVTEILLILTFCGTILGYGHSILKKFEILGEKVSLIERWLSKLEEKVDSNEKSTQMAFLKMSEAIMDIKLLNGKLESSFGIIKEGMQCQKRESCRE